ncbi:MAG: cytochrome b/b6 domain-containing protein, partial [Pseudomonadota bacterium]
MLQNLGCALSGWARLLHWLNAFSVFGLMSSGWAIFNAAPFYALIFPSWITLGGGLTEALRWHFTLMWIFAGCVLLLVCGRVLFGRGGPVLARFDSRAVFAELGQALRFRLEHKPGIYLHTQCVLYLLCLAIMTVLILSGLAL